MDHKMPFLCAQILGNMSDMENVTAENIRRAAEQYFLNEELTLVWKSA
jgi:predicted Zn-dependent peptidase